MENNLLLVPVQVDSLFLAEDSLMAEPMAEFARLPFFNGKRDVNTDVAYVSENFISPPLQNRNQRFRAGLHLHWSLPDALTHGVHISPSGNDRGGLQYPALPDRWLVERTLLSNNARKRWLVESNFLWPEETIFEDVDLARESLKRAIRLVRNFEALPQDTRDAMTEEAKVARLNEVTDSLRNCIAELDQHLDKPAYSFFEGLYANTAAFILRLEKAAEDIENAGLDDLRPGLSDLLYRFFDRRKESISFPVQAAHIRSPKDINSDIKAFKPLLKTALRTANILSSTWGMLDAVEQEIEVNTLKENLSQWLREPSDTDDLKFIEELTEPSSTITIDALLDRILAIPIVVTDLNDNTTERLSYPRFHKFSEQDIQDIKDLQSVRLAWPEIWVINRPLDPDETFDQAVEDLQISVLRDCFMAQHDALEALEVAGTAVTVENVTTTADALLQVLNNNATTELAPRSLQPFRYLGRTLEQGTNLYREDRNAYEYLDKLTVMGYGEPAFAAFYPNCSSVLGFQDTDPEIAEGPSYAILGWYDRPDDSFLKYIQDNAGKSDISIDDLIKKAKWQLPLPQNLTDSVLVALNAGLSANAAFVQHYWDRYGDKVSHPDAMPSPLSTHHILDWGSLLTSLRETPQKETGAEEEALKSNLADAGMFQTDLENYYTSLLPANTSLICYARIEHNGLEDGNTEMQEGANNTTVTLANTGREALAALLAHKVVENEAADAAKVPQIEDQLESVFFMDDLDQQQLDIGPKFRETRHAQGFNAVGGEVLHEVKPENIEIATSTNINGADPVVPKLDSTVISALQTLNSKQREFDLAVFKRDSLREQLFVDWYKYMLSAYPPQDSIVDYPDVDEVRFFVEQNDIRPLLDLMFQTGQITQSPEAEWEALGFAPLQGEIWPAVPNLNAERTQAQTDLETALDTFNGALAADIKRADITDWNKLISILSQPITPANISSLFNELSQTELGPALQRLQALKTSVLEALNAGWNANEDYVQLILGRYGLPPERSEDPPPALENSHIINWNGLLSMLVQRNPASIQTEVDNFKSKLNNATQFQADLEGYMIAVAGQPTMASTLEASDASIEIMIDNLVAAVGTGSAAVANRDDLSEALLNAFRPAPRFVRQQVNGPRFYQPKEPTVLIAGDIAEESTRFARDGRQSTDGNLGIQDWQSIVADTVFQDWQSLEPTSFTSDMLANVVDINDYITAEVTANGGTPSSNGAPWNPFMLEWMVELCPLQESSNARDGDYQADYVLRHYDLKVNAVDLEEKPAAAATRGRNPNIYINRSLLTTQAFRSMEDQLKPYLEENDPSAGNQDLDNPVFAADKANTELQQLKGKILAQSLSGFNAAMLMLQQNLQLPVDDPIGFTDYKAFTEAVARLVGFGTKRAPNPLTDFSPLRTGKLQINTLRLVDTFGRIADLDISTDNVLSSSLGSISSGDAPVELSVPPRLAQAARLHFRWLSAEPDPELEEDIIPESVNDSTSTPICGWLMSNQLDRSLVVFDANGLSLGAIDSDAGTVRWRPAPGWESLTSPSAISNEHLKKVVAYLLDQSGAYIESFIDDTNLILRNIEPESFEQQQSLALLMGRPMAIVRANIDMEMKGIPAVHHGWGAFYRDRQDGNFERETDLYSRVRYPIRIGADDQLNDGLIGYWLEDAAETLDGNFYLNNQESESSNAQGNINYLTDDTPITQSLEPDDPDQTVCILMDPRAKMHAFSGVLPTKVIDIPAEQYLSALQAIDITFLTTPVLTPAERISVPRSIEEGYEWEWIEQTSVKSTPTEKGTWLEVREYTTILESTFLSHFSGVLHDHLMQNRWLNPADNVAVPNAERPLLAPEFTALQALLEANTPAGSVITPAQLNPVSQSLLDTVLKATTVKWLEDAPTEGSDKVYRILAKEERVSTAFDVISGTEFAGFEARVDAILTTAYQGFRAAVENGHFFDESVWIREGWLKLQKR